MLSFLSALAALAVAGVAGRFASRRWLRRGRAVVRVRARLALAALLGLLAAGLYSDWVLERRVDGPADPRRGFVSELGAVGQVHNGLFNALQVATGLLLLLLMFELRRVLGTTRLLRAATSLLVVFAAGNAVDGVLPMDCAPSLSTACAQAENAGLVSWRDRAHTVESVATIVALLVAMALLAVALARTRHWRALAVATAALVPPLTALETYQAVRVLTHHLIGTVERVSTALITVWLAALALAVLRRLAIPHPLPGEPPGQVSAGRSGATRSAVAVTRKPQSIAMR